MSKIFNKYLLLKKDNPETFFLFNTGLFYIFIDKDAEYLSNILNIKLVNLNTDVHKCGFPTSQILKYSKILNNNNIDFKIVEDDYKTISNKEKYINDVSQLNLTNQLSNINTDTITPYQALNMLIKLKESISNIEDNANSSTK